jgi:hypothetical protein
MIAHGLPGWLLFLFPVVWLTGFVLLGSAIIFALSRAGGWHVLAGKYRAQQPFAGELHRGCSGRLGFVSYKGCLTLGASERGLYLAVPRLLAFAHPPLFIPWSDVRAQREKMLWAEIVRFELGTAPATRLQVQRQLADKIVPAARGHLLIAPRAG